MFQKFSRGIVAVVALAALLSTLATGSVFAASATSPNLNVTFPSGGDLSSENYVISGCGYGTTSVTIVVHSPMAISFTGQTPDSKGCISVSNFYTQGSGQYVVDAYQDLHGSKDTLVASTSFTV
jgi:hypothetical protein